MRQVRMKTLRMLVLTVIVAWGITAQGFCADEKIPDEKVPEEKITGSASVGVLNRYIFRGYEIGKSGLVIQPSLSASLKGFSATFWGNIDTNQRNTTTAAFANEGRKGFNETDLTLSHTHAFGKLSLTGGYTFYSVKYAEDTEEFFATIAYDILTKPTLSIYQDVNAYPGTYMNLSFAHSFPVYKKVTLDLGASFGYFVGRGNFWKTYERSTGDYTGSTYKGFHDGMVKAGLSIPVTSAFMVQPIAQYYFPLSGDANRTMGYDTAGNKIAFNHNGYVPYSLVAGINLTYNF
jgi:hypothetical protein